jgi:Flp pilus assembly protein protease CpaA
MQVLVLSETGRGSAHDLALASIRAHHPEATVVVVVTHPAAAAGDGPTMAITARDLSIGGLPYTQAWLAGGPAFLVRLADPAEGVPYGIAIAAGAIAALPETPFAAAFGL